MTQGLHSKIEASNVRTDGHRNHRKLAWNYLGPIGPLLQAMNPHPTCSALNSHFHTHTPPTPHYIMHRDGFLATPNGTVIDTVTNFLNREQRQM